jgi:hypothetical protein
MGVSVEHCWIGPRLAGGYGRSLVFADARDEKTRKRLHEPLFGLLTYTSRSSAPQPLSGRIAVTVESSALPPAAAGRRAAPCGHDRDARLW